MMDIWAKILGQNWAFYSHQKLYDMVKTEATGASAVTDADQTWSEFTDLMGRSRDRIGQLLNEAGASWRGLASESMQSGVTPLAQWTDDASTAGTASSGSVQQVGEAFSFTANAMPEPVPVTSTANSDFGGIPASFTHLFGGQTDQDRQERAAAQAKQRAVEVMQGYSRNADAAASSLGMFVPPQRVTVNVPPPQPSGPSVGYTSSSITGPSGEDPRSQVPPRAAGPPPKPVVHDSSPVSASAPPQPGDVAGPATNPAEQVTTPGSAGPPAPTTGLQPVPLGADGKPLGGPNPGGGQLVGGFDPVTGFPVDPRTGLPVDPRTGVPIDPRTGRPLGHGPGGGGGRGLGGFPGAGGGPEGEQPRSGRGGGLTGAVPLESERAMGARGGSGMRGGASGGVMGPVGAGAGSRGEEDREHYSPEYLRAYHDFWDDLPPLAPPAIGEDESGTGTDNEGDGGGTH
jgi:hypothetical protein